MGEEGQGKKRRVVEESLEGLTESLIMPRKHGAISGVGSSSILELKAQLYQSWEESKRLSKEPLSGHEQHIEVHRAKKKIAAPDTFSHTKSGVAKYICILNLVIYFDYVKLTSGFLE
ncbi:unnamed protein product, partial [Ilex paraguariensis]